MVRNTALAVVAAGLFAFALAIQTHVFQPSGNVVGLVDVHAVSDGSKVNGAWSLLRRDTEGVNITFNATQLVPRHVVTLEALVFNNPAACADSDGNGRCGERDVDNPATGPSLIFIGGALVTASRQGLPGSAQFKTRLGKGSTIILGNGITNPFDAAFRLILVDHGAAVPALFPEMLGTPRGGCTDARPGTGTPGPNTCTELQFAVHQK